MALGGQFLGPGDVAHAVFGHVQVEFPVALRIGDAEQGLAFLHRAAFQPVLQVPGDDLAVDRTMHFEIGNLGLCDLGLGLQAAQLLLRFGQLARQPRLLVGLHRPAGGQLVPDVVDVLAFDGHLAFDVGLLRVQGGIAEFQQELALLDPGALFDRLAVDIRPEFIDLAFGAGVDVLAIDRLQRSLGVQVEVGRHR